MSSGGRLPESLRDPGLGPLWSAARNQLDRLGRDHRGTVPRPVLAPATALALRSLLGRTPPRRVPLSDLEAALVARSVGSDLDDALTRLGHPPSATAAARKAARARRVEARRALASAVETWPEPWATEWAEEIKRAGLIGDVEAATVERLATDVRRLLDRPRSGDSSRTELAAQLYGSAHALDLGTRRATLVTYALRHVVGPRDGRDLWEEAGIVTDRVSAPVLTWRIPASGISPIAGQIRAANAGCLPLHLSSYALRRHPVDVPPATPVHVVENPRIVEAAAERNIPGCLVAANGNPSTAVTMLLAQLTACGAVVRYHGDFDAPGIAMCARMHVSGIEPWLMGGADYASALHYADAAGVTLEHDPHDCVDTPWDPTLAAAFRADRRIVHEELIVDQLLTAIADS
jgi:uncharacterized protein (TIGR02679 family)